MTHEQCGGSYRFKFPPIQRRPLDAFGLAVRGPPPDGGLCRLNFLEGEPHIELAMTLRWNLCWELGGGLALRVLHTYVYIKKARYKEMNR